MGFPRVVSSNSGKGILANTFTITFPTGIEANQIILILLAFTTDADPTLNSSSYESILDESTGGQFGVRMMAWYAVASGGETSVGCTTSSAIAGYVYNVLVIDSYSDSVPRVSTITSGNSTAPDSSEVYLAETANTLWLAVAAADDAQDVDFPADYNLLQFYSSTAVGPTLIVAGQQLRAVSEDPDAFYLETSDAWLAATIGFINNITTWTRFSSIRERSAKTTVWRLPDDDEHVLNTGSPEDLLIDPEDVDIAVSRVQEYSTVWSPQSFNDVDWTTASIPTSEFYVSEI